MYRPVIQINIGKNDFDFVTAGDFSSSWQTFTDTGVLVLPHKFVKNKKTIYAGDGVFKKGDPVRIKAGYFPKKELVFEGYVAGIKPSIPVEIALADAAFLLKQVTITLSFESISLKDLLSACLSEAIGKSTGYVREGLKRVKIEAADAQLGAFRITRVNMVQVLEQLKKTYALTSYFRGHDLFVGLAYNLGGKREKLTFYKDIISDDLEYLKADDIRIKIKAISLLESGGKIEVDAGDPDGDTRTLFKYNVSERELKAMAEREASRFRFDGFRGSITTFLTVVFKHGDEVELVDPKIPERDGIYLIEAVDIEVGVNGYFQTLKLGAKIG
jgi:hypothetical protein